MIKYTSVNDVTKMIKHIMIDDGIKQKDIAANAGIGKQTVSNLLSNRTENVGINTIRDILDAMGYDLYIDAIKK